MDVKGGVRINEDVDFRTKACAEKNTTCEDVMNSFEGDLGLNPELENATQIITKCK